MAERSGYSVYFSTDLRQRVSDWADNSTSSQADILDKALEDFFDTHEISDDGTIVSTSQNRGNGGSTPEKTEEMLEQIIENQEVMLSDHTPSGQKDGADIFSEEESDSEGKNLPASSDVTAVEEVIAELAGEYDHDEVIPADDVSEISFSSSDVLKQTPEYIIPAITGMINDLETDWVDRDDIEEMIVGVIGMSASSARNYKKQMVSQGVLRPHPSVDDDYVGDEILKSATLTAAQATQRRIYEYEEITNVGQYPDDVDDYVSEYVDDWSSDKQYLGEYCVDDVEYLSEVWRIVDELCLSIASKKGRRDTRGRGIDPLERQHGAKYIAVQLALNLKEEIGVELVELVTDTAEIGEVEEYKEWAVEWQEVRSEVRRGLFGEDDEQMEAAEARAVLGVDDGASDDEILDVYEEYVLNNHPDAGGSDSEMDVDEFQRVLKARRVLTA